MEVRRKREASYDFEEETENKCRKDSDSDLDGEGDMFYDSTGDSKSFEEFISPVKMSDRKKHQYHRMASSDSVLERRESSDREYRRERSVWERSVRERRERNLFTPRGSMEFIYGRGRGRRGRGRRRFFRYGLYRRGYRALVGYRERSYHDRESNNYSHEDSEWTGGREGRRSMDRGRRQPEDSQHEDSQHGNESSRSRILEEMLHQLVRRRRRERRERSRTSRDNIRGRRRGRPRHVHMGRGRNCFPPEDSPIGQERFSGLESSEESGQEDRSGGMSKGGQRVEIQQDNIESLIKEFEEGKGFGGDSGSEFSNVSGSEFSNVSSPCSIKQIRIIQKSKCRNVRGQTNSLRERSDFISSAESEQNSQSGSRSDRMYSQSDRMFDRMYDRKFSHSDKMYSHSDRMCSHSSSSKSRSTDFQESHETLVGQLSKSSHRFSKGELKEGSKDKDTSTVVHCDSLHTEKKLTEEEQKKLEAEHEKLSAQFAKDIREEELGGEDGMNGDLPVYYPALMGCRSVESYEWLNRIEEGTYGVVHRGRDKRTGEIVALKKLKIAKEKEGFPITSLREINMLLKAKHPNIVHVKEIVVGSNMDKIFIVMEYVEHDLKNLMEMMSQPFRPGEVKTLIMQLLSAVNHLHDNWILHRDLKASNLLLSHKGILKVGDFGLAREYGSPLKPYTPVVVTLWYRCPELLLGQKEYSTAVDMWSVGCIFAEFIQKEPLFRGKSEIDMVKLIFKELGTPSERIWPGYSKLPIMEKVTFTKYPYSANIRKRFPITKLSENGFELLNRFLTYDPKKRVTAAEALTHKYFKESPMPIPPSKFPTWPAKSEMLRYKRREKSPRPPSGGKNNYSFNYDDDKAGVGYSLKLVP